jgi:hypothetical protein
MAISLLDDVQLHILTRLETIPSRGTPVIARAYRCGAT